MKLDIRLTLIGTWIFAASAHCWSDEVPRVTNANVGATVATDHLGEPFLAGRSVLMFAQSHMISGRPLDAETLAFFRNGGQDNVSRLIGLRREVAKVVESGVHNALELDRLDSLIDAIAGQLYASRSGLFWHTDLDAAMLESQSSDKPVLSLRMLGKLTDEQSCANSRWFRILLYSDSRIADLLRDNFVLHWHTVRPVPKVTVDFGDGREIRTTLAGNSIHYVLFNGRVVDAFPGFCGPDQFIDWLNGSLTNVNEVKSLGIEDSATTLSARHASQSKALAKARQEKMATLVAASTQPAAKKATGTKATDTPPTVTKRILETPLASAFDGGDNARLWMQLVGEDLAEFAPSAVQLLRDLSPLHGHKFSSNVAASQAFDEYLTRLRRTVSADGLLNAYAYLPKIYAHLASVPTPSPSDLDAWVHENIFAESLDDPWYGLLAPGIATGLKRNGIRERAVMAPEVVPTAPQGLFDDRLQNLANELFGE